ncbi:hypothetical protein F8M41_006952 [Gigaspora margarita]|uniref:Uncharacterized protein n=1 Tax=Gigaspora margarita TaxID=4874 RepID=A0A8H4AWQ0_GIGMA|nr:hypothetical protein F8M41_006952 [Gigaspora margarita]
MFQAYKRTLAKIIENQGEILFELKVIKDKVRRIENHLNNLEQKIDNSFDITNDKAFKEDMIKEAAKALIRKVIYPENSQIKSLWGTLINKIKETLFSVYGNLIESINNKANPVEVIMWKKSLKTNECYQMLFKKLEEGSDNTYINQILNKIWPNGNALSEKIAYAIAICQTMLNPKNKIITMSDHIVKKLIAINLNKLNYCEHFSISSSEDKASKEDRDKSDDNDSENDNTTKSYGFKSERSPEAEKDPEKVQEAKKDLEKVQEAEKDPDEDVDKEKDTDDEKNMNNDEYKFIVFVLFFFIYE